MLKSAFTRMENRALESNLLPRCLQGRPHRCRSSHHHLWAAWNTFRSDKHDNCSPQRWGMKLEDKSWRDKENMELPEANFHVRQLGKNAVVPKLCSSTCCANFRTSKPSGCDVATWVLVCFISLHWASSPFLKSLEPIVKFWILWIEDKHPWLVVNIAGQAAALVSKILTHKIEFVNALTSSLVKIWTFIALTTQHGILPETLFVDSIGNKLLGVLFVQAKLWEPGGVVRQPILPRTMSAELWHWAVTARLGRKKMQTKDPHGIHGTCANP